MWTQEVEKRICRSVDVHGRSSTSGQLPSLPSSARPEVSPCELVRRRRRRRRPCPKTQNSTAIASTSSPKRSFAAWRSSMSAGILGCVKAGVGVGGLGVRGRLCGGRFSKGLREGCAELGLASAPIGDHELAEDVAQLADVARPGVEGEARHQIGGSQGGSASRSASSPIAVAPGEGIRRAGGRSLRAGRGEGAGRFDERAVAERRWHKRLHAFRTGR